MMFPLARPYLSTITIKWNAAGTFDENLERIITQKWISMYPDGQEAWSEFRRTGYPKLFPVVVNNSGGKIPTNTFIAASICQLLKPITRLTSCHRHFRRTG
jgi:hypothetical protein